MAARGHLGNTQEADIERSSTDIRQDIAKEKENISKTVAQIGEHITNQLDWHQHVKRSPYWALGIAVGLGALASGKFSTPVEQTIDSLAEEVHNSLADLHARSAAPGVINMALLGVATQIATGWIKNANSAGGNQAKGA